MIEAFEVIGEHFMRAGYSRLQYKPLPYIYSCVPAQDDLYALFRLGAKRVRCDLSCSIDLAERRPLSERRRRGLKKSKGIVTLSSIPSLLSELWHVIAQNLYRKHDARPVHSLQELTLLQQRFPSHILVRSALLDGVVEAGIILFKTDRVWHAQYIGASEVAYGISALDAVFNAAILEAQQSGARYFDFGTSNEDSGMVLNDGLYRFKSELGGGGVGYDTYQLTLDGDCFDVT